MNSRCQSLHPWPQRRGEGHLGVRLEKRHQEEVEQHQFLEAFFPGPHSSRINSPLEKVFNEDQKKSWQTWRRRRCMNSGFPRRWGRESLLSPSRAIAVVVVDETGIPCRSRNSFFLVGVTNIALS